MDLTKDNNLTISAPLLVSTSLNIETNSASSTPTHQSKSNSRPFSKKVAEEIKYDDAPLEKVNETAERKEDTIEEEEHNLLNKSQGGCTMKRCYADAHEISFKPGVFCEFFLLHVLFYFCLGPFIIILSPIVGIHLLKNQSFIGWRWPVFRQYLEYITVIGFLILYYTWNTNGLQAIEIYMLVVAVMIRIVSISSKYAYQSDCFIKLLRTETLTDRQLARHLPFLPEWRVQSEELIETELHSANLRLEIDSSLFFFHFIEKPSQELMDVLSKREQLDRDLDIESITMGNQRTFSRSMTPESRRLTELLATSRIMNKKMPSETDMTFNAEPKLQKRRLSQKLETDSLDGFTLAFDIIKNARIVRSKHLGKYAFLVAVVRALIPTFYRAYQGVNLGEDVPVFTERPYVAVPLILINSVFFWMCFYVVIVILEDIQGRIYSLKQVEHLLSARKVCQSSERKLCPTMNIFDPVTLKAWLNLRKLIEDYGKKYVLRNNFNVTVTLTFYAIILLILNLQLLGIIHIYSNPPLLLVFAYESVVFFAVFIASTMGGAVINEQFTVHKGLLRKNKLAILDFQKMSHLYVGENAIEPDKPLYREGLKLLKEQLGEEDFQNKLVERAEVLVNIIDSVIEELDFEATSMPFTVMGVAVDFTLVKSFLVAAASLIFAIVQRYIN